MRQRRLKDLEERMEKYAAWIIEDASKYKNSWREYLSSKENCDNEKLFLEFGCGKGQFVAAHANDQTQDLFLAVEGQESVAVLAAAKLEEAGADNVKLINEHVKNIEDFFGERELNGLYLNFSDPWPKARHAKRRLTHRRFLESYKRIIQPGGFVEFKTDNDDLYNFTLEELECCGLEVVEKTDDLHSSQYKSRNFMTEYEEKFSARGKNINYIKFIV